MIAYSGGIKRTLDVLLAGSMLLLLSPLFVLIAAAIVLDDGSPVIFRQQRAGRYGRNFTIYKFRSMPVTTPNVPSVAAGSLIVTRVGRVIRRTNFDELPQLWNVLRGDMSLVGPRPALLSQQSLIHFRKVFGIDRLRPGLTGLAQVNAYDGMPESQKLEWDKLYAQRISFGLDLLVMIRTFGYLTRRPPVY